MLGRRDLAEDLAQETWIRLATHAGGLRPDTRLGAWLYTVARNLTLSFRRWSAFSGRRLAILHRRQDAGDSVSPFDLATAGETQRRLEAALASLPEKYREVLLLVGVEGLPREDAAAILGLRPDALRQRLLRARAMMEDRLGPAEAGTTAAATAGPAGDQRMSKPEEPEASPETPDAATRSLLAGLRTLAPLAPDRAAADRTRARARALFVRLGRTPQSPLLAAIGRLYARAEPAIATCVVLAYLTWAFQTAAGLIR